MLPNLYAMTSEMIYGSESEGGDLFKKHITLNDALPLDSFKTVRPDGGQQYFNTYSKSYENANGLSDISNKFMNLMVSHSNINIVKDYNNRRELFPMYYDIEFSTDRTTDFAELLKKTNMSCVLMKSMKAEAASKEYYEFFQKLNLNFNNSGDVVDSEWADDENEVIESDYADRKTFDITDWFEDYNNIRFNNDGDFTFLGLLKDSDKMEGEKYKFYKALMSTMFTKKLDQLKKNKIRTYKEIMEGRLADSETIMYRIEKSDSGETIQNYYLPNSNEINVHRIIDTQVKYNKEYTYKIYACELVYGTKYSYSEPKLEGDTLKVKIESKPSIKIIEIPYYEYKNKILDNPPVQPNVEIVPYRGVNNEVRINLSPNSGKYNLEPVMFKDGEYEEVRTLLAAQDRTEGDLLEYESDDNPMFYEVWRLEKHPSNYSDFTTSEPITVDTNSEVSTTLIDSIQPNKKYWYTFRSIDNHDHVSYPTPVYQVEMVDSDGSVYPLISVVDFKDSHLTPKASSKKLKKVLHLFPSLTQGLINRSDDAPDKAANVGKQHIKMGSRSQALFGDGKRRFKIRLTSKKTGRKIDINVGFKHEHKKIVE